MVQLTEISQARPQQFGSAFQVAVVPGEQSEVMPGPRHTIRGAPVAESRFGPPMPVSGRIPLADSTGHVPKKGARDRRTACVTKPLAALKRAAQDTMVPAHLPRRPGKTAGRDEDASLTAYRGVIAHSGRVIAVRSRE